MCLLKWNKKKEKKIGNIVREEEDAIAIQRKGRYSRLTFRVHFHGTIRAAF